MQLVLKMRGACREQEELALHMLSGHSMTQVSLELTKGRLGIPGTNTGERMYLDALLDLRKKQAAVRILAARPARHILLD